MLNAFDALQAIIRRDYPEQVSAFVPETKAPRDESSPSMGGRTGSLSRQSRNNNDSCRTDQRIWCFSMLEATADSDMYLPRSVQGLTNMPGTATAIHRAFGMPTKALRSESCIHSPGTEHSRWSLAMLNSHLASRPRLPSAWCMIDSRNVRVNMTQNSAK